MLTVVIVIHLMIVIAMIAVVLLQKSEGGGLVSSSNAGFMTGRGTANVLTRTTAALAIGFFVTSLTLSWLAGLGRHPASIINTGGSPATQEAPANSSQAPLSQSGHGLLDQLRSKGPVGAAPSGPQVPQSK
ncbi:MAG TPA: preprotein translocase subunit SecG [Xanthobacteraceae bacterium]|nr:preprotein translocase subunit SecG [Xanthobacteraceae bacterium]